jgi:Kdo2-lipid IVA lauroyltransferase/acyltransferase
MKLIKYFFEFIIIIIFFLIFKILGYKNASNFGSYVTKFLGPFFRSKKLILNNIKKALPDVDNKKLLEIYKNMWSNYGRILSEYIFIKDFRTSKLNNFISVDGEEFLKEIRKSRKPVIFVSGHFNNFELMAMQIEMSEIKLSAIYRPLNNIFLNKIMEPIRKNYICKNQIPKGLTGLRKLLTLYKQGSSIAIMIDQRVSEGVFSKFFGQPALTTTIPAQLVKKFQCKIVPVYIERINKHNFKMTIHKPVTFDQNETVESITEHLNEWLEKMILKNPDQWIWSHNRWK